MGIPCESILDGGVGGICPPLFMLGCRDTDTPLGEFMFLGIDEMECLCEELRWYARCLSRVLIGPGGVVGVVGTSTLLVGLFLGREEEGE